MLLFYLKTSVKYLTKHTGYLSINLLGLATALSVCFLAFKFIAFELSYDSYHEKAENIYRLSTDVRSAKGVEFRGSSAPIGPAVAHEFADVKAATTIGLDYVVFQNENGVVSEEKIIYGDSTLFSVFSFPLVEGDPMNVLNTPFTVVLSERAATKYFGIPNPVGEYLTINGKEKAFVTGVMKDIPLNSHFRADVILSMSTLLENWNPSMRTNWRGWRLFTYLVVPDKDKIPVLTEGISNLMKTHIDQQEMQYIPVLEPLKSLYLHSHPRGHRSGSAVVGDAEQISNFALVASAILIISCLNFVNLSTAFSMKRGKEIGVRKILGAGRMNIIAQVISDAVILSIMAGVLALAITALLLPLFNEIVGKPVTSTIFDQPSHIGILFLTSFAVGLLSGFYPGVFLSRFKSISVAKGFVTGMGNAHFRRGLVAIQFCLSFVLMVMSVVVFRQLSFMQDRQLGFDKEHKLVIDFQFDNKAGSAASRNQLANVPGVTFASISSAIPGRPNHRLETFIEDTNGNVEPVYYDAYFVDFNFLEQFDINLVAGRPFSHLVASDSTEAMIINETAVKKLGFHQAQEAIGKTFRQSGRQGKIIGVVKDFHLQSFREEIQPLSFQFGSMFTFMTLTIARDRMQERIAAIEQTWKAVNPNVPMVYFFIDDAFDAYYQAEQRFGKLFASLVATAVIIACVGLTGLSAYNIVQRTKEISVRKVLGSSRRELMILLTRDFSAIIAVSMFAGLPIAFLMAKEWLDNYAYRATLSIWLFVLAALALAVVAIGTILLQTFRAASTDPAKALHSE